MTASNKDLISRTLARRMMACVHEYEAIKEKKNPNFKTVKAFCLHHKFSHQNFMKIYHRFKQTPFDVSLLPQKRGPKFQTRRTDLNTEKMIIELRNKGNNRYEIKEILKQNDVLLVPCATTIYNICKRHGLNKLNRVQKQEHRKIVMSKAGELVHIDCHQLS